MKTTHRTAPTRLLVLAIAALVAGCATTQMNAEWRDPALGAGSLKGQRVLVVCRAPDEAVRRMCEDQWTSQLGAQGVAAGQSYSIPGFPWPSGDTSDELRAAAQASGVAALVAVSLAPADPAVVNAGPQVGIGIGGGSGGGYRGGGFGYGGIGITLPVGGTTTQGLGASTSLVDVGSGKLVWSGSASTPGSGDVIGQVGALAQVTSAAMRKAGLL